MKKPLTGLLLTALLTAASLSFAEDLNYNLINLYGEAQKQIENDVLAVTMRSAADADTHQEAAEIVNRTMTWALGLLEDTTGIKKQTINYQTRPRYQNEVIVGWSVSQELLLESEELDGLSDAIGRLQQKLQLGSMNFGVSPQQKKVSTDELITEALMVFKEKARLVTTTVGANDFRFVTLTINENAPPISRRRGYQMETMAMSAAESPPVEAGESKLTVRVDGTIQLIF